MKYYSIIDCQSTAGNFILLLMVHDSTGCHNSLLFLNQVFTLCLYTVADLVWLGLQDNFGVVFHVLDIFWTQFFIFN